jgi:hypothetical protein
MVNYGYECKGWTAQKKEQLASELAVLLRPYSRTMNPGPIIEVDETYPGVRMRKLTWIPEAELTALVAKADDIYDQIDKGADE